MALFTQSAIPWVTAVQQVADSAGASADAEMTQRAHNSLRAAFLSLNSRQRWNFLRAEQGPIAIVAPFTVTGVTASGNTASAAAPVGHGFQVSDIVIGSGMITGNRISATAAGGIGFESAVTGFTAGTQVFTMTVIRDSYDLPSDYKITYSLRLLGAQRALNYIGRRVYDRSATDEYTAGTPERYDLYNSYGKSKIRLVPPPSQSDTMVHRYYRRMAVQTASGATTVLDIPEDYEIYPVAWAKWHFLTDKGEGKKEQATTWLSLAQEGLKTMLADQNGLPDEDLAMVPGHSTGGWPSDRATWNISWDTA